MSKNGYVRRHDLEEDDEMDMLEECLQDGGRCEGRHLPIEEWASFSSFLLPAAVV